MGASRFSALSTEKASAYPWDRPSGAVCTARFPKNHIGTKDEAGALDRGTLAPVLRLRGPSLGYVTHIDVTTATVEVTFAL